MKLIDIINGAWAIKPEMLDEIQSIYARHLRGAKLNQKEMMEAIGKPRDRAAAEPRYLQVLDNGVALLALEGVMGKKMNLFMDISGGTSTQMAAAELAAAADDPLVISVFMDVDSPGGAVDGTQDMMKAVKAFAAKKPIVAFTDGLMASAAYWIGSAANKIIISNDTAEVGSIGVIARHIDYSKQLEVSGIKETQITAGKFKSPYPDHEPLSEFGRGVLHDVVNDIYSVFLSDVSSNRGLSMDSIEQWADGKVFMGKQAIKAGLVDSMASRDEVISEMAAGGAAEGSSVGGGFVAVATDITEAIEGDIEPETKTPAAGGAEGEGKSEEIMNRDELKAKHPEVFDAIYQEGAASVDVEGLTATARTEGAAAEVQRQADVRAQSVPGFEALVDEMAADGKTTGPEAAQRLLAATREALVLKGKDVSADAAGLIAPSEPVKAEDDSGLTADEKLEKTWAAMSTDEQAQAGGKDAFMAFSKEGHKAKVLGGVK